MEDAPRLDWNSAEVEPTGTVNVRWQAPGPSGAMAVALTMILNRMESEARGQVWESVAVHEHGATVEGMEDPTATEVLRLYLSEACDAAPLQLERENRAIADARQSEEEAAAKAAANAQEIQRRLRAD